MFLQNLSKIKKDVRMYSIYLPVLLISACNSASTTPTGQQSVNVPLEIYSVQGVTKYYSYTSVGGGVPGKTIIDTGSDVYFILRSQVGPNVVYTSESVILYYDFGNESVPGVLAYAPVTMYNGDIPVITSSVDTPIVVVESVAIPFNGLMGVGMRGNLSPQLYFQSPYNQAMSVNLPESTLSFGKFDDTINSNGASWVQLDSITCNNYGTPIESSSANCWNTFGLPVQSTFNEGESTYTAPTMNGLLDTGSDSGFQLSPFPSYINVTNSHTTNFAYATIQTSTGPLLMYMTSNIYAVDSTYNGGNFVNIGNNVFNYYQIIFDRYDGKVWFKAPVVN